MYLHPHLRRRLKKTLKGFQNNGHQVLLSTHSQELIGFSEKIVRLTTTPAGTSKHEYVSNASYKIEDKLFEKGNHEIVFASKVILTESKNDQASILLGLSKYGLDLDTDCTSVIDCGGIASIPAYAYLCKQLGIPWLAVHDLDMMPSGSQKPVTERTVANLAGLKGASDEIVALDNDLESAIGFGGLPNEKVTLEWLSLNFEPLDLTALKADTSKVKFYEALNKCKDWLVA